jgi:hypothetical protein
MFPKKQTHVAVLRIRKLRFVGSVISGDESWVRHFEQETMNGILSQMFASTEDVQDSSSAAKSCLLLCVAFVM